MGLVTRRSWRQAEKAAMHEVYPKSAKREYSLNLASVEKEGRTMFILGLRYETAQNDDKSCLFINIKPVKEKTGMTVETQIKVSQKKGEPAGPYWQTVSLYHATCLPFTIMEDLVTR